MGLQATVQDNKQILTPNQVAELLMVSPAAVRQWAAKGELAALTTPGGHRRFKMSDVLAFAATKGMSLNTHKDSASILIVDDDIQFANMLKETMSEHDERLIIQIAHDGYEAGKLVQSCKPDLIFLDLRMPTMDGLETCKRIKQDNETKNTRIVCMTGYNDQSDIDKVLSYGAEACLIKPIEEQDIVDYLDKLFD